MANQTPFWNASRWVGADPKVTVRRWVAGFLRVGVGLSLLSIGIQGYIGQKNGGSRGSGLGSNYLSIAIEPLLLAIPYLGIALGVALIVGFLTTATSIGAAFYSLLSPVMMIVMTLVRSGPPNYYNAGAWGIDPMTAAIFTTGLNQLLPYAALIWLSPIENHPISVDALIFGQPREPVIFATNRPEVETAELVPDTKILPGGDHSSG